MLNYWWDVYDIWEDLLEDLIVLFFFLIKYWCSKCDAYALMDRFCYMAFGNMTEQKKACLEKSIMITK